MHFRDAGIQVVGVVVAEPVTQDLAPVAAAIARLVEASLAARGPQRALHRRKNHVRVARVDAYHADVFGPGQTQVVPVFAAVATAVDACAVGDVPPADVFTGADPDRMRIVRIDRDAADRIGVFVVEDRRPGRAAVDGLPDAARADADVPGALLGRVDRDVGDPAGHQGRADAAHLQSGERLLVETRLGPCLVLRKCSRQQDQHKNNRTDTAHLGTPGCDSGL